MNGRFFTALFAVWLAFALLCAQTLGVMHHIVHTPQPVWVPSAQLSSPGPGTDGFAARFTIHGDLMAQLFAAHDSDVDCRAYDQLSHIDAMPGFAALVLPLVIPPFLLAISSGLATARWHALFQARGPPPFVESC